MHKQTKLHEPHRIVEEDPEMEREPARRIPADGRIAQRRRHDALHRRRQGHPLGGLRAEHLERFDPLVVHARRGKQQHPGRR